MHRLHVILLLRFQLLVWLQKIEEDEGNGENGSSDPFPAPEE